MMLKTLGLALVLAVGLFADEVPNDPAAVKPLPVGAQVPDGRLRDLNGEEIDFLKTATEKPSVVIFYRGGWCPYCNIQMEQLIALEPRLKALGYQILAISPDSPASMRESLKKHAINYRLLSDSSLALTQKFGLAWKVGKMENFIKKLQGVNLVKASGQDKLWLPVPAAFVIDRKGRITYEFYDPNYIKRVDPEELYREAEKALKP